MTPRRSAAVPLAVVTAAVIVYASLYPWAGWDHPAGWSAWRALSLPWPSRWTANDAWLNVLGYLPFGALAALALARGAGWRLPASAVGAVALATLLSLAMELLQNFLPRRVPSSLDLAWNAGGAALGVAVALLAERAGWLDLGGRVANRWFEPRVGGGLTLLLLWPAALLIPTPVALGLGQVFDRVAAAAREWIEGSFLERLVEGVSDGRLAAPMSGAAVPAGLSVVGEAAAVTLGLLAPCLLAYALSRPAARRMMMAAAAATLAIGMLTLSTVLGFGPQHALAWVTPAAVLGIGLGLVTAFALAWVPARAAAGLALIALTAQVSLVAHAPPDPYFAQSLQAWEQGRWVRFHGAAQWIGWLWPYAAIAYLLGRVTTARRP